MNSAWEWLADNSKVISLALSFLMLVVWVTYLQLLLFQFWAARKSSILITRAAGKGMRSRCLVTNMSTQPLYITSLIGALYIGHRKIELALTDLNELPDDLGSDPRSSMVQGSLSTGQYLNIGHFDSIVVRMLQASEETIIEPVSVDRLDLTVVAFYGGETLPVGAVRSFSFDRKIPNGPKVQPLTISTEQITQRQRRRELLRQVERHT